ncbi:MAG: hypothetical protein EB082_16285, partial [Verrucomicrobia bacterium]|nr:hypothetical protein [Verrucomicrobiota bacterium]
MPNSTVKALAYDSTGTKMFVGGLFTSIGGVVTNQRLALLDITTVPGARDTTFNLGAGVVGGGVNAIAVESAGLGGAVWIGGDFTTVSGLNIRRLARLTNAPYGLDTDWRSKLASTTVASAAVNAIVLDTASGSAYATPGLSSVTVVDDNDYPGGGLDPSWNQDRSTGTTPVSNPLPGANNTVNAVAVDSSGRSVIVGDFTAYDSQSANRIVRALTDGQFDNSFKPGQGADNYISTIAIYFGGANDGKHIIGGGFTSFDGTSRNGIARLLANGALDTTFNPGSGFIGSVRSVAIQPNGQVVAGGAFTSFNGTLVNNVARLNSNGSLDTAFSAGAGANGTVYAVAVDSTSSKIYIGGDFTTYNGVARNRIARLNTDGTLDTAFDPGTGADDTVYAIAVLPSGKVIVGGNFLTINQLSQKRLVQFTTSGAVDTTFNVGSGLNSRVTAIALDANNQANIVGAFTSYNGT